MADPTDRVLEHQSADGIAWRAVHPEQLRAKWPASLAEWLVRCPGAHPLWSRYYVGLCHLRPVEGPPAVLHYDGAEHELMVWALDPNVNQEELPALKWGKSMLSPPNLIFQFHGVGDAGALKVATEFVRACVEGRVSIDTDHRSCQLRLLHEAVAGAAAH